MQHLQECSFRHSSTLFYPLAAGLLLFCCRCCWGSLLNLVTHTAVGGGSWTPNLSMVSSKFVFFVLAAGPLWGGRIRTSWTTASTTLEFGSLPQCWRMPEGPLLKMRHSDGSEMSRRFLRIRPRSSSPENKIIPNTECESLNQFFIFINESSMQWYYIHWVTFPLEKGVGWALMDVHARRLFGLEAAHLVEGGTQDPAPDHVCH